MKLNDTGLWTGLSLSISAVVALVPIALYYVAQQQSSRVGLLYCEATFYLSVAFLFFYANRYSRTVALFALVRWACESWATFGRAYRTRFFGVLALFAFVAVIFELFVGEKVTHHFKSILPP